MNRQSVCGKYCSSHTTQHDCEQAARPEAGTAVRNPDLKGLQARQAPCNPVATGFVWTTAGVAVVIVDWRVGWGEAGGRWCDLEDGW